MARPSNGVTLVNMYFIDRYFSRALKDNRLHEDYGDDGWKMYHDAKEAFKSIPDIDYKNESTTKEARRIALQNWINNHVPSKRWQRCLMTQRQHRSRKKLKLRKLDLPEEVYDVIRSLAEKMGVTMGDAIYSIARPALDKIYADEYA